MDVDKLAKVLAMLDSANDGEAVAAWRAARQMLNKEGMTFQDIALATKGRDGLKRSGFGGGLFSPGLSNDALQGQVRSLKTDLGDLQARFNDQVASTQRWQQRAEELQRSLNRHEADKQRLQAKLRPILEELTALRDILSQARPKTPAAA
ncbi:MAG TPA: hypothetical protein VEB64_03800 [Azospirillaceae bacterium]|nr:hypothetical protein [Azospirillaceae bacterium]